MKLKSAFACTVAQFESQYSGLETGMQTPPKDQDEPTTNKAVPELEDVDKFMKRINCWNSNNGAQKEYTPSPCLDPTNRTSKENKALSDAGVCGPVAEEVSTDQVKCDVVENLEEEKVGEDIFELENFDQCNIATMEDDTEFVGKGVLSSTQDSTKTHKKERAMESSSNQEESDINVHTQEDEVNYSLNCHNSIYYNTIKIILNSIHVDLSHSIILITKEQFTGSQNYIH